MSYLSRRQRRNGHGVNLISGCELQIRTVLNLPAPVTVKLL